MSVQFGALIGINQYNLKGHNKDCSCPPPSFTVEQRKAYAESVLAEDMRENGETFVYQWVNTLKLDTEDLFTRRKKHWPWNSEYDSLRRASYHSRGGLSEPEVFIVTRNELAAKRQIDRIQREIDEKGIDNVNPKLLEPISFYFKYTGRELNSYYYLPRIFDPREAIELLKANAAKKPTMLDAFMRFVYFNIGMEHLSVPVPNAMVGQSEERYAADALTWTNPTEPPFVPLHSRPRSEIAKLSWLERLRLGFRDLFAA